MSMSATSPSTTDAAAALAHGQARDVLRARAAQLAEGAPRQAPAGIEVLRFRLADGQYALETGWVRGVHPAGAMAHLPCAPATILGLVAVRARVLPVIDLRGLLGLAPPDTMPPCIVLVQGQGGGPLRSMEVELALPADAGATVVRLESDSLQPPKGLASTAMARLVRAIAPDGTTLLDMAALLSDPRLAVDQASDVASLSTNGENNHE